MGDKCHRFDYTAHVGFHENIYLPSDVYLENHRLLILFTFKIQTNRYGALKCHQGARRVRYFSCVLQKLNIKLVILNLH